MSVARLEISTITAKGQTTVPKSVRQALGVDVGGKIAFRVDERGVSVHRADTEAEDPVLENFLAFLARDLHGRPDAIKEFSPTLAARIASLIDDMVVDPAAAIEGDVAL